MSKIIQEQCTQCNRYTNLSWKRLWISARDLCYGHPSKVTDLEEMPISELKTEDYIMISDVSEKKSKKIKILTLIQYFNLNAIPQIEQVIKDNNKKKIDALVDAASLGIFDKMMK